MIKVAVLGLGFMGKVHFRYYKEMANVQIIAVCDVSSKVFEDAGSPSGNIAVSGDPLDLTGVRTYTDFDQMLRETDLDAISITLPTYLHSEYTVKSLEAGLHVLCEKPMALDVAQCSRMISASNESGKLLQIGHCIRFWPEYVTARELIDSNRYGRVLAASLRRLSGTPVWSWDNWLLDGPRSSGACLDLHIHDTDYVSYVFGMPVAVRSHGIIGPSGEYDHVVTSYIYNDDKIVTAEGGWMMSDSFGFEMSFNIIFERATISYDSTRDPVFKVCPSGGKSFTPEVSQGDGYYHELMYFIDKITGRDLPEVLTAQQSMDSIELTLFEQESIRSKKECVVKLRRGINAGEN